jgi:FKBP-type peptidyl-prolyl cis-trans isomerase SlyD
MNITRNKFVSVVYDLNVGEDDERVLMEQATEDRPLEFIFGVGAMLPSFENQLKGLTLNDAFRFSLAPDQAYGEYAEENVVELSKKLFEVDGKFDAEMVKEGHTVPMMDAEGHRMLGSVLEVNGETVLMDFNHPLAGETLHFSGKIIALREATTDDVAKLSGCGCGCNCSEDSCACNSENDSCSCGQSCACDCH